MLQYTNEHEIAVYLKALFVCELQGTLSIYNETVLNIYRKKILTSKFFLLESIRVLFVLGISGCRVFVFTLA